MNDRFGRNINYARISLTDKCNLRCVYCMPSDAEFKQKGINELLSTNDYKFIIKGLVELGINKIRFTGGEPLLHPDIVELIRYTYEECGIDNIGITTNAIGLCDIADELYKNGLKSVNISVDSLKEYRYKSVTRGGDLKEVIKAINKCLSVGLKVKINCVVIKDFNEDEVLDFIMMTSIYPIDVRFIELMPLGEGNKLYQYGYFNIFEMIENIDEMYKVNNEENSAAQYYKYKGAKGRVGVITPMSCSFCSTCNRIRVTSNGSIKLCLHSKEELDIKPYLNKPLIFREIMKENILEKPQKHHLNENQQSDTNRNMYQIGG
ncbi:GTP 3',8-cyclase MoaA [Romboutsia lituseburensis]|uniref:GTP 3',8-cyclase n=1 Tax=Romboutsia lituseburensis DSM 797 TaxID=1121325 RepID=A0A1G9KYP3_9FIRM|nr:GTP 3',8-cyclase MoaA [Romboutsia lituseburensis]CEH35074.1 Cyclic pyranopterin monophosphate synthase [Romboutsia lituseburensis]SDL54633.1 cyclic pyranopterin monophosphate synthase subunit MoaA [Romboutsia lituseburensis DSM 797]